jgi:predicted nucleic acid-binding protein
VSQPIVLAAGGLDELSKTKPSDAFRALLREAWKRDREVFVPAVVCAELARGVNRTRALEATLSRHDGASGQPPVSIVDTDFDLARLVGSILFAGNVGTEDLVDAHVVAVCAMHQGGLIVTADPDDIHRLAQGIPAVRVITCSPG